MQMTQTTLFFCSLSIDIRIILVVFHVPVIKNALCKRTSSDDVICASQPTQRAEEEAAE